MLPTVSGFLTYLKGLSPKNRIGLAFGSYGWSGQGVGHVEEALRECGFNVMESIKVQFVPNEIQLQEIFDKVKLEISSLQKMSDLAVSNVGNKEGIKGHP